LDENELPISARLCSLHFNPKDLNFSYDRWFPIHGAKPVFYDASESLKVTAHLEKTFNDQMEVPGPNQESGSLEVNTPLDTSVQTLLEGNVAFNDVLESWEVDTSVDASLHDIDKLVHKHDFSNVDITYHRLIHFFSFYFIEFCMMNLFFCQHYSEFYVFCTPLQLKLELLL
jgi:hypothetical protein